VILQLDLLQEGGLTRDVKVMGSGLHTGLHHSLPVESNKKDRIGNGTHSFSLEINTVPQTLLKGFNFQYNVECG
jgi:hypothetical protein